MESHEEAVLSASYGAKAVNLGFNPSHLLAVQVVKTHIAELINDLNKSRTDATDPEVKRMLSLAITDLQTAQMWATKALTWEN